MAVDFGICWRKFCGHDLHRVDADLPLPSFSHEPDNVRTERLRLLADRVDRRVISGGAAADALVRRRRGDRSARIRMQAIGLFCGVPFLFLSGWTTAVMAVLAAMIGFGFFKVYTFQSLAALSLSAYRTSGPRWHHELLRDGRRRGSPAFIEHFSAIRNERLPKRNRGRLSRDCDRTHGGGRRRCEGGTGRADRPSLAAPNRLAERTSRSRVRSASSARKFHSFDFSPSLAFA